MTQVGAGCLREREGEMEALAEPLKSQEGVRREVAGGHLAVRLLVAARRALALKPPDQEVDAGAAVLADSRGASARAGGQLAVLTCGRRERERERRNEDCDVGEQQAFGLQGSGPAADSAGE